MIGAVDRDGCGRGSTLHASLNRKLAVLAAASSVLGGAVVAGARSGAEDARLGTVQTVAGPSFCDGSSAPDLRADAVRALAVDPLGGLLFDTGPAGAQFVGRVGRYGQATRLVTGLPAGADPPDPRDPAGQPGAPSAGRLAPDGVGGVLIAVGPRVVDLDSLGGITTVAGDAMAEPGSEGRSSSGDGGPAMAAHFRSTRSIAVDEASNLYVADAVDRGRGTVRIRFVNRGGGPVTFYPGTASEVTVGPGAIGTIAGTGTAGIEAAGDGGPATGAVLQGIPPSLAVAGSRLYVAAYAGGAGPLHDAATRVRLINLGGAPIQAHGIAVAPGAIDTVLGPREVRRPVGSHPFPMLGPVPGIAADSQGNLFLADEDHDAVRRLDPAGSLSTVAGVTAGGSILGGFNGNDRPATTALLDHPADVKLGRDGQLYIADGLNGEVRIVDSAGIIRAAPGAGVGRSPACQARDDSPRQGAPVGIVADRHGDEYVASPITHQVLRVDASGRVTVAAGASAANTSHCRGGSGCTRGGGDGGPASEALLDSPMGLALSPRGDLYIADVAEHRVRFVNLGPDPVTVHGVTVGPGAIDTVAGNGSAGVGGDGGAATRAQLGDVPPLLGAFTGPADVAASLGAALPALSPIFLAVDARSNLFIGDPGNHRVRRVDPAGTISTFAGEQAPPARSGCCRAPAGLALDPAGNLYVADQGTGSQGTRPGPRVWVINRGTRPAVMLGQLGPPGQAVPVVGSGTAGLGGEGGPASQAQLTPLTGIAVDRRGDLYIEEVGSGQAAVGDVRRVDTAGVITVILGNGSTGFNGDDLKGRLTSLDLPVALDLDACGNLLVADLGNGRVRRLTLAGRCPLAGRPEPGAPVERPVGPVLAFLAGAAALATGLAVRRRRRS